ncbi:MAG TPA: beta-ketoacyl synthase N-terminal-like domain-containing protein [Phycisphaerae bacterium]|nr:beta-ketoacyl synthase N-terminal-like domain-containing protein [Phycisphaerae bacterium]
MANNQVPIAIWSPAACTSVYPSLDNIFDAWLSGAGSANNQCATSGPAEESALWKRLINSATGSTLQRKTNPAACGLILATTKGDVGALEIWIDAADQGGQQTLPTLMSDTANEITGKYRIGGPVFCLSTACTSSLSGLIEAAEIVRTGEVSTILVCGADVAGGMVRDGFMALHAISPTSCKPFDTHRDGLMLGSAAAACLVCRADDARLKNESPILLDGWAITCDAVHLTAPDRQGAGLTAAIRGALEMAQVQSEQIDVALMHGTATPYNDAMEAAAIRQIFSHRLEITAVKGLIGHTLGASGLIETLLADTMLRRQTIPPITGLAKPDFGDLQFVQGMPLKKKIRRVLKTASGFGGMNAAVVLRLQERGE